MILTMNCMVIGKPDPITTKEGKNYYQLNIGQNNGAMIDTLRGVPVEIYQKVNVGSTIDILCEYRHGNGKNGAYAYLKYISFEVNK